MNRTREDGVAGYFEPELTHTFLPGCRKCGGSHPLARKPQLPADKCPDCGAPAGEVGATHVEKAVLAGYAPSTIFAKACLSIGRALTNLATRK